MKQFIYLLCLFLACGCSTSNKQEKHQSKRNNIVNVHDKVKEIDTGDVLISDLHRVICFDNYLVFKDAKSYDKILHIFDANTYKYITSTGNVGQGPGEIAEIGAVVWDKHTRQLYATDAGSMNIYAFQIDSVLTDSMYLPQVKTKINLTSFPREYTYINDTLSFCREVAPTSNSTWDEYLGKFNLSTGKVTRIDYPHPDLKLKRVMVSASPEKRLLVVTHLRHDLMSILDFDGRLICNVYGPDWDENNRDLQGFGDAVFYKDKILALYDGRKYSEYKQFPKIIVFTQEGDYEKTLDVGYEIDDMTLDETNHRLILSCNDEIQFGYLELDEVI